MRRTDTNRGWFLAAGFIFIVGVAMAELGSALPTSGGLYWWTHFYSSPKFRNPLCFLVGYSNTLGLIAGICSIDYGFALMFLSVISIARDGTWTASNGLVYVVFLCTVACHGLIASTMSKIMGKLVSPSMTDVSFVVRLTAASKPFSWS